MIEEIERRVVAKWLETGAALVCSRCGGLYIPSRTSDPDLCGCCFPARNISFGDGSVRHPECDYCRNPISGRRADARFCCDSCKTLMCRKRARANAGDGENGENSASCDEDIVMGDKRKQITAAEVDCE